MSTHVVTSFKAQAGRVVRAQPAGRVGPGTASRLAS